MISSYTLLGKCLFQYCATEISGLAGIRKVLIWDTKTNTTRTVIMYDTLQMSHLMRKPTICLGENKDAGQRLCFRYSDSTIPLLLKSKISSI